MIERRPLVHKRKLRMQKSILLSIIATMAYGIAIGYSDFYQQFNRYTQSLKYRESREALNEYYSINKRKRTSTFTHENKRKDENLKHPLKHEYYLRIAPGDSGNFPRIKRCSSLTHHRVSFIH